MGHTGLDLLTHVRPSDFSDDEGDFDVNDNEDDWEDDTSSAPPVITLSRPQRQTLRAHVSAVRPVHQEPAQHNHHPSPPTTQPTTQPTNPNPLPAMIPPPPPPVPSARLALEQAANRLIADSPSGALIAEVMWQREVKGEAAAIKQFRSEALQRTDLLVFAYMRPASPFIHLLHTAGTFSLPSGDEHYRGKDIAFVGDRTDTCVPTPVLPAPEQPWK